MTKPLDQELAEMENQVVTRINGRDVTQGDLSVAFDKVADKAHWKNPIDKVVDLDDYTKALVGEAVTFFTGSVATFEALTGSTTGGMARYRVKAAGYYLTIGA